MATVQNPCRTCLDLESERVSIFEDPLVRLYLKSCLSIIITETDDLSKTICISCVSQLRDFYNFQLNAKCSQDWLESATRSRIKKSDSKIQIQPLPDSEYNSDSLLEFLNNTENIEEYLSNLGKEDIPSIVNMMDRNNENSLDFHNKVPPSIKNTKLPTPKKKEIVREMEIDVLDSDAAIVQEILSKGNNLDISHVPKSVQNKLNQEYCIACNHSFESAQKLSQHLIFCEVAMRTCNNCNLQFDCKQEKLQHLPQCSHQNINNTFKGQFSEKPLNTKTDVSMSVVYRCKQCNETFPDRKQSFKHAKQHLRKASKNVCDICAHGFVDETALSAHKQSVHASSNDLLYRCKVCQLTSSDKRQIYVHVQEHRKYLEPQRHLCEACGRSFATRNSLLRHLRVHSIKNAATHLLQQQCNTQNVNWTNHETTMCEHCGDLINNILLESHRKICN